MNNTRAKKYNRIKLTISLLDIALELAFWLVLIGLGIHKSFAARAYNSADNVYLEFFIFILIIGFIKMVIELPLSFYSGYLVEHQFKLSNQSIFQWIFEQIKGLLLGLILGGIVIFAFYWILLTYPAIWWLITWLFLMIFSLLLSRLAPVLIFPLFYKFEKIEREDIKARIDNLAIKYGLKIEGIFRFNLSKTTKKANAAFTGIGKSKRVILGDTLLENFNLDEIESVFAHEIGHFHKKHLMKGIVLNSLLMLLGLFSVSFFYKHICADQLYQLHQLEALPYLGLLFFFYGHLSGPLSNYISRKFEFEADQFAVSNSTERSAFTAALQKLSDLNLADETPHPLVEFLFHSHPSITRRIAKINTISD